ncbi:hypothetical protein [uncultured Thiodictyon sp.]|uniref:beta strand repeat-containing protein n=1 Tax=uncultured Thiodictyon sp. TaxID=1846217 RepID=UPI0025CFBE55|nr:hypothetical protein [uncultured Thiodictyon sp.]
MNAARYPVWTLLVLLLATWSALATAEPAPAPAPDPTANQAAPIPAAELGRRADAQQAAPTPVLDGGRATLAVPLQALRGEVGPAGLSVDSTSVAEGTGRFRLTPGTLSKGGTPTPVGPGVVRLSGQTAVLDRGALTEVFSASADGLRQDFVVAQPPAGDAPLTLTLALEGVTAADAADGIALTLPGGRKLVYHHLHITDAAGQVLTGQLRRADDHTLAITVADAQARYPITIDPTITDADWQVWGGALAGANRTVQALAYDSTGSKLYVGGDFSAIGTVKTNGIAQWDGSVWSALGGGIGQYETVYAMAVSSGGTLYVGGSFTTAGGVAVNNIAQWDGSAWTALGNGLNSQVQALAVFGSTLYAGGYFDTAGAVTANYIAQWNGSAWSNLGTGLDSQVNALAVSSTGILYAGGGFTAIQGGTAGTLNHIAQWNGSAWLALGNGMNQYASVMALAVSGSTLYAGGYFSTAGGVAVNNIAQWSSGAWSDVGGGMDQYGPVNALAVSGSTLYAGGSFSTAGGVAANAIAQWNGTAWSPLGSGISFGMNGVTALAVSGSGTLYAGGDFTTAGGVGANGIAQWSGSAWSGLGTGMDGAVNALAVSGSGTTLYVGGAFTTVGGVTVNRIAQWNGSAWSALGSGMDSDVFALAVSGSTLYAGGRFSTAGGVTVNNIAQWDIVNSAWSALGSGMDGDVYALAVSGGTLYAGGYFSMADGKSAKSVAQWNGNAWSAVGSGMNQYATVYALAVSGSTLYAGGWFTTAGTVTTTGIAQWNGTAWSALGSGIDNQVNALAVSGSTLYAGGWFSTAGTVSAPKIAQWNILNNTWSALGSGLNSAPSALAVSGGTLYVGGGFTRAGGLTVNHIAQWDIVNSTWSALGSGLDNQVNALAVLGTTLYVGGNFLTAGNKLSPYAAVVRLSPCGPGVALTTSPTALWQQLALPCVPSVGTASVANVLGNGPTANLVGTNYGSNSWLMYDLPPTATAYRVLTKTSLLTSGTGYWIKSLVAPVGGQLRVAGTKTPVDTALADCQSIDGCAVVQVYSSGQPIGYKLIGNPFPYDVDWSKVRVRVDGTVYTPSQAAGIGGNAASPAVLSNQIWIWNGNTFQYWTDTAPNQGNLQYFKAFWVKVLPGAANKTIELLIPAEASTVPLSALPTPFAAPLAAVPARPWYLAWLDALIPSAAAAERPAGAWVIQLKVEAPKTGWKAQAKLGQWPGAEPGYDPADLTAMAPFASPYLTLVFPQPAWGARKGDYGTDLRPADGWPGTWNLELRTDPVGAAVVLRWTGDPAILARSRLTDKQTGKVIDPADPAYVKGYPLTLTTKVRALTWEYLGN